jgi:nucleoside-diphosphate-sugar epimerase
MKIGILGCGYVGQAAALHWKEAGHYVTASTRKFERFSHLENIANEVCLLTEHSFPYFIEKQKALLICVAPDAASDYASTYLETAKCVAKHTDRASNLQQIIYTSSTSLYGDQEGAWVDENMPIQHLDENKRILYETEQILLSTSSQNRHICILRLGEIYGPGREIEARLKRMQHQSFAGNGESYTNLIHLSDIVNALHFALTHQLQGIYNLCNDFHIKRRQFYQEICQKENIPSIQWDPTRQSFHGGNRRVSNEKIKNAGFTFKYPYYFN